MGRVRFESDRVATRIAVVAIAGVALAGLVGCSEDVPTDYAAAHREAFLAACSRPLEDPRLLSDICGCVYDRIEDEVPFDRFQQVSERLSATPSSNVATDPDTTGESGAAPSVAAAPLPDEITRLIADCFTVEADL